MKRKELQDVRIRDALYNTHIQSGASIEYGRGIIVGVVSGLCAAFPEHSFDTIWLGNVKPQLPEGYRKECIPEGWPT